MRDFFIFILFVLVIVLGAAVSISSTRIKNVERKACKIEQAYDKMIEENEALRRQTEAALRIAAEGWEHD